MFGTPKTLGEAISRSVTDFLSQHFTASALTHPECEPALDELWKAIRKDSSKVLLEACQEVLTYLEACERGGESHDLAIKILKNAIKEAS